MKVNSGRDYKHLSPGSIPVYGTGGYMLSVNEALSYEDDAIGIGRKGTIDKPYKLAAPFWTVDTLFYAIPQNGIHLDFMMGVFQGIDWKQKDESTGVPSLSKNAINDTLIYIPSDTEQKVIGSLLHSLDQLITLHQRKFEKQNNIGFLINYLSTPQKSPSNTQASTLTWERRELGEYGNFYYGKSAPKWSVRDDAPTPCIRYGELYTKFGTKIEEVFSYTTIPHDKLVFSKGTEVLIPRVGEDPWDYNHCTWLSLKGIAIGEMISVYDTKQNPLFTATMFNATLQKEFAIRVEGGSVTNLYYDKLKNILVSFPSLTEQEKIASLFSNLDDLITLHQRE